MTAAKSSKKRAVKFKKRYVLGEGYPSCENARTVIALYTAATYGLEVTLDFPYHLNEKICPRYRLVLERI